MKTSKFFVAAVAAMGMVATLASCEKDPDNGEGNGSEAVVLEGGEISGRYSNDLTLKKGEILTKAGGKRQITVDTTGAKPYNKC